MWQILRTVANPINKINPSLIVYGQSICFFILYSTWMLPQTNFLSDLCLIVGAILSLRIIFLNINFFKTIEALPFWLLFAVLFWVLFHLLFLSTNFYLQKLELSSIWKRSLIVEIFALGFGMGLRNERFGKKYWSIFAIALMMPTFIFYFKYCLLILSSNIGFEIPDYLRLFDNRISPYFIYKTAYTFFSVPALCFFLVQIFFTSSYNIELKNKKNCMPYLYIILILGMYYLLNIKNGFLYAFILILSTFVISLLYKYRKKNNIPTIISKYNWIRIGFFLVVILIIYGHFQKNPPWKSLYADSKIAVQVFKYDHWKYNGAQGYPSNEYGNTVAPSTYERISWTLVGMKFIVERPFGYGLLNYSFHYLAKEKWPDSNVPQTHNSWLDLTLGIGVPGFALIILSLVFTLIRLIKSRLVQKYRLNIAVILMGVALTWLTSECDFKVDFLALLFWISFGVGLSYENIAQTKNTNKYSP